MTEAEYSGDEVYEYIAEGGLLESEFRQRGQNGRDRFEYTFDTSALMPLAEWSGASGEQITRDDDGIETERTPFSVHTRGRSTYRIGECEYEAIGVQIYYRNPDEPSMIEFAYLTELKIPLIVGFGGPGYYDPYKPVAISKDTP